MEFSDDLALLYKYRSLAGEYGRSTAEDIILHDRMFWQNPAAFNDPFDCSPAFRLPGGRAGLRNWAKKAARNVRPDLPRLQRLILVRQATKRSVGEVIEDLRQGFLRWMEESAIACFASAGDVPLMWSHYADSHRGMCFVFQEQLKPTPFIATEVSYSEERPSVDLTNLRTIATFKSAVLVKDKAWSYEGERRMLDYRRGPGNRSFPPECLIGLILGARISDSDVSFIAGLNDRRAKPLPISRASLHQTRFSVEIG